MAGARNGHSGNERLLNYMVYEVTWKSAKGARRVIFPLVYANKYLTKKDDNGKLYAIKTGSMFYFADSGPAGRAESRAAAHTSQAISGKGLA